MNNKKKNYQKAYLDVPTSMSLGSSMVLVVVEASNYSPARAALRIGNGSYISLEPSVLRELGYDLIVAAEDVEAMRLGCEAEPQK